jgi:hypothetical protein
MFIFALVVNREFRRQGLAFWAFPPFEAQQLFS